MVTFDQTIHWLVVAPTHLKNMSKSNWSNLTPIPNVNENKEKIPTNMHEQKYKLQTQS